MEKPSLVRATLAAGRELTDLSLTELQKHNSRFDTDALARLDVRGSLQRRNLPGGTGPDAVREQLQQARAVLAAAIAPPA